MDPIQPKPATPEDAEDTESSLDFETVSHCSTLNEAQMVVSLLGSFGIEATIDSENYNRMFGSMIPSIGGVQVQVRQPDAKTALEILNQNPEQATLED
ncbi:MAG: DUF2007 domain-containing protein [Acidobacteriaceae bacterium]